MKFTFLVNLVGVQDSPELFAVGIVTVVVISVVAWFFGPPIDDLHQVEEKRKELQQIEFEAMFGNSSQLKYSMVFTCLYGINTFVKGSLVQLAIQHGNQFL